MSVVVLVTGGARSGKSRFAEARLRELAGTGPLRYIATAEPCDDEMRLRIARHREARGARFETHEAPRDLEGALDASPGPTLVDCITVWLSNRMLGGDEDDALLRAVDGVARAARGAPGPVVLVTNEVGGGIVPDHPLGRRFRDLAGFANQRLAAVADEVVLVACGLPLRLR